MLETTAVHAGAIQLEGSAVASPICLSTTFEQPSAYVYSRRANPARHALESCLGELEKGDECACFASGAAAVFATCLSLNAGDHVIFPNDAFFITRRILQDTFVRLGILSVSWVDMRDLERVRAVITPRTRMLFAESPTNPLLERIDLNALIRLCHEAGVLVICDNTIATPVFQRPLELGADFVVVSTTKYLAGHNDAVGGAVIWSKASELSRNIRQVQGDWGAVPSPFDCWLTLRGIKTLPVRVRAQSEAAAQIAVMLAKHPAVSVVHYPGYDPATCTAAPYGGLLSFELHGGAARAIHVVERTHLFTRATSFGGTESLIERRAATEGGGSGLPESLIRLSIGLENVQDLIDDLRSALQ